jgi:clorobiocin biosynthesis protein Clo-hal
MPRAIGPDVVGEILARLAGVHSDIQNVFRDSGLPPGLQLARCRFEVLAPFRLDLRSEPSIDGLPPGELDIYHDLVTDDARFAHRLAAVPCKILPELAPVVDAISRYQDVPSLLAAAPSLLGSEFGPAELAREATLAVVGVAAMKGFLRLRPDDALGM